jgi:hypothetical protein
MTVRTVKHSIRLDEGLEERRGATKIWSSTEVATKNGTT